jgi:hypothetical protein
MFDEHSCERMAQNIRTLTIPVLTVDQDGVTDRRGCDSEVRVGSEHGLGRGNTERVGQPDAVEIQIRFARIGPPKAAALLARRITSSSSTPCANASRAAVTARRNCVCPA